MQGVGVGYVHAILAETHYKPEAKAVASYSMAGAMRCSSSLGFIVTADMNLAKHVTSVCLSVCQDQRHLSHCLHALPTVLSVRLFYPFLDIASAALCCLIFVLLHPCREE